MHEVSCPQGDLDTNIVKTKIVKLGVLSRPRREPNAKGFTLQWSIGPRDLGNIDS